MSRRAPSRHHLSEAFRGLQLLLLAAGIAHDFANALSGAGLHVGLVLADGAALPEPVQRHCQALQQILGAMGERTRRLRELARERHELVIERVQLGAVVSEAAELARAEFRSRSWARVEVEIDDGVAALPPSGVPAPSSCTSS